MKFKYVEILSDNNYKNKILKKTFLEVKEGLQNFVEFEEVPENCPFKQEDGSSLQI